MNFYDLVNHATNKERFHTVEQYIEFCTRYLESILGVFRGLRR